MLLYLKLLGIMCIVSFIKAERIILLRSLTPQQLSQKQNGFQIKLNEIKLNRLVNKVREEYLLKPLKKKMIQDLIEEFEGSGSLRTEKQPERKHSSSGSDGSSQDSDSGGSDSGDVAFRDLTRQVANSNTFRKPKALRREGEDSDDENTGEEASVKEALKPVVKTRNSDENITINFTDLLRTVRSRVNFNHIPNALSYAANGNKNNRIVYRRFGTRKAAKKEAQIAAQKAAKPAKPQKKVKKKDESESESSDSSQSEDVNQMDDGSGMVIEPKSRIDKVPKRFEVVKNEGHKKGVSNKHQFSSNSDSDDDDDEVVTTTKKPKRKKKKKKKKVIVESSQTIEEEASLPMPEPEPLSDEKKPEPPSNEKLPKKHEKKEIYLQAGRIVKTGSKSSESHSDENFRRGEKKNVLSKLFPNVDKNTLKKNIMEVMRTVGDKNSKPKKKVKKKSKKGKKTRNMDGRRRLPIFLPKRIHWKMEDFRDLGYFWFNGPQGKIPGVYRVPY